MRGLKIVVVLLALLQVSAILHMPVQAQKSASDAVRNRITAMSEMGRTLKALQQAIRRGGLTEDQSTEVLIERLRQDTEILPTLFAVYEKSEASEAREIIWTEPEAFAEQIAQFATTVESLVSAYETGNNAQTRAAIRDVMVACGDCHQIYRDTR